MDRNRTCQYSILHDKFLAFMHFFFSTTKEGGDINKNIIKKIGNFRYKHGSNQNPIKKQKLQVSDLNLKWHSLLP